MVVLMKGMTCIKCPRKVAKVFAIFVIDYFHEIIKETEEITLKTLQYTFYSYGVFFILA